jgi:hypothetical protein
LQAKIPARRNPQRVAEAVAMDVRQLQVPAALLGDERLVSAVAVASLSSHEDLIAEIVRRCPAGAVAALEALCRRFKGFGLVRAVPEQVAALWAIAAIGGLEAKTAIINQVVHGPGLPAALSACRHVNCRLPDATIADRDCIVQLGRIVRTNGDLAAQAVAALEAIDDDHSSVVLAAVHRARSA